MATICATLELKTLRDNIALVTHEPCLFHDILEENIRYGNRHATAQDIRAAARAADIHDFILSLPQGYQTVVGEKGIGLSAGQRQRIAIARAILREAKVWIFDEATAALDVLTELRIQPGDGQLAGRIHLHRRDPQGFFRRAYGSNCRNGRWPHHAGRQSRPAHRDARLLPRASSRETT